MSRVKKELKWYALYWDSNEKSLKKTNVIHKALIAEVKKAIKKGYDSVAIKNIVKSYLLWRYWSKYEWEVLVSPLFTRNAEEDEVKIDIWTQLEPNLDVITEYLITNLTPKRRKQKEMINNEKNN